jgi:DNA modification methylase
MNPKLNTIHQGESLEVLKTWPSGLVHTCVTSPPYFQLRDYKVAGQIGLETSVEAYIEKLVVLFREVRRVMRDDGTMWLNIGDTYAGRRSGRQGRTQERAGRRIVERSGLYKMGDGLKNKDLMGIPWTLALALRKDGWYLRSDIIWAKPNCVPSSVVDRPTLNHEYIFLLTKKERYFYDSVAIEEPQNEKERARRLRELAQGACKRYKIARSTDSLHPSMNPQNGAVSDQAARAQLAIKGTRNKRTVWNVATTPFKKAHFATFPKKLIEPCILAGTSEKGCCIKCGAPAVRIIERGGGSIGKAWHDHKDDLNRGNRTTHHTHDATYYRRTSGWKASCKCEGGWVLDAVHEPGIVLDPFAGAGTTCLVAKTLGRQYLGIELNPEYIKLAEQRISDELGLLA